MTAQSLAASEDLQKFLQREIVKLRLEHLKSSRSQRKSAALVLLSTCSYLVLAAAGFSQTEAARLEHVASLDEAVEPLKATLNAAKAAESGALKALIAAEELTTQLQAELPVQEQSENVNVLARKRTLEEANEADARQARQKKQLNDADERVRTVDGMIKDFLSEDNAERQGTNRPASPVPRQLNLELERAKSARAAICGAPRAQAPRYGRPSEATEYQAKLEAGNRMLDYLEQLRDAKRSHLRAANTHASSERDRHRADDALQQVLRERSASSVASAPLQLPVLGISIPPRLFFQVSPWLVLVLAGYLANMHKAFRDHSRELLNAARVHFGESKGVSPGDQLQDIARNVVDERRRTEQATLFAIVLLACGSVGWLWWCAPQKPQLFAATALAALAVGVLFFAARERIHVASP